MAVAMLDFPERGAPFKITICPGGLPSPTRCLLPHCAGPRTTWRRAGRDRQGAAGLS
jgi:hypothetical protein